MTPTTQWPAPRPVLAGTSSVQSGRCHRPLDRLARVVGRIGEIAVRGSFDEAHGTPQPLAQGAVVRVACPDETGPVGEFDPDLFTDLIPADRDAALARMMRENIRPATIRAAGYIGAETDLRPVLPTVDIPTLILHGEADARSPLANAERLHAAISSSQLVVLPKLGHACVVEDPEACAAEVRRFVKTVS